MPKEQDKLAVRRHDRRSCDLPGQLSIAEVHEPQIVFSNAVADTDGSLSLRVVDCSEGGLGLRSPVYVPRGANVTLTLVLDDSGEAVTHAVRLRVQRAVMVDRSPAYYLGTSLVEASEAVPVIRAILGMANEPVSRVENGGAAA